MKGLKLHLACIVLNAVFYWVAPGEITFWALIADLWLLSLRITYRMGVWAQAHRSGDVWKWDVNWKWGGW